MKQLGTFYKGFDMEQLSVLLVKRYKPMWVDPHLYTECNITISLGHNDTGDIILKEATVVIASTSRDSGIPLTVYLTTNSLQIFKEENSIPATMKLCTLHRHILLHLVKEVIGGLSENDRIGYGIFPQKPTEKEMALLYFDDTWVVEFFPKSGSVHLTYPRAFEFGGRTYVLSSEEYKEYIATSIADVMPTFQVRQRVIKKVEAWNKYQEALQAGKHDDKEDTARYSSPCPFEALLR